MAERDTQDYLTKGIYGNKKTNPDERNKYFGSLRERVYLSMTVEQLVSNDYLESLKKEIQLHPNQQLLLNGQIDMNLLSPYIKLSQENDCSFRIVSDEGAQRSPLGLIYVSTNAVNEEVIDAATKYPQTSPPKEEEAEEKKDSFFKKLFS
ncbi:YueI family protein [Carnobacterium pleistocenium]|uniref:YueI family protein n=1 Tax=Carnobacterium pleistocenium TaxID=181073 RepID=UPI00055246AA|nr:YueI family protein [Carnobacterium pleistocenium]